MSSNSRLYRVYINELELPIAPGEILTTPKLKNRLLDIIDGEFNLIRKRGLTDFELDVRLPCFTDAHYTTAETPMNQQYYLTYFEELIRQQLAFEFTVLRPDLPSTNNLDNESSVRLATLENYEILENGSRNGDIILRLKLKQYLHLEVDETKIEADKSAGTAREVPDWLDFTDENERFRRSATISENDTLEAHAWSSRLTKEEVLRINNIQSEKDFYDLETGTTIYYYDRGGIADEL